MLSTQMRGKMIGSQLTSISTPYSGDSHTREQQITSLKSIDLPLLTTDFGFTGKNEPGTEASGDQLTEPKIQKKESAFDLEATITPQNQTQKTSQFPPSIKQKNWIPPSQISQASSPPLLINHESPQTLILHPLWEQWLKSPQRRLSRAPSLEPPDLQYPPEPEPRQGESGTALKTILRVVRRAKEKTRILQAETRREDQEVEVILRRGETPEEGEIQEETQQIMIEEVIASLGKNQRSSMEIVPKWKDSSLNGRSTMA